MRLEISFITMRLRFFSSSCLCAHSNKQASQQATKEKLHLILLTSCLATKAFTCLNWIFRHRRRRHRIEAFFLRRTKKSWWFLDDDDDDGEHGTENKEQEFKGINFCTLAQQEEE